MMRSSRYTAPRRSTTAMVSAAASLVTAPVMKRTISGSTRSHTVVSVAQNRSSSITPM